MHIIPICIIKTLLRKSASFGVLPGYIKQVGNKQNDFQQFKIYQLLTKQKKILIGINFIWINYSFRGLSRVL